MQDRYLPNLNGLRAISVFVVMLGHATSLEYHFGGYQNHEWLWINGSFGVNAFFCISGILISYLLDQELRATGKIDIRQFYLRRAARIWPLYFLVVIPALVLNVALAGTSLHQSMNFYDYLFLFLILPGFADRPMFIGQTWSIGVEESFYAVYPLMVRHLSRRGLAVALLAIVFSPEFFALLGRYTCPDLCSPRFWWAPIWYSCIPIGCLVYLAYGAGNERLNRMLFSPALQCFSIVAVAGIIYAAIQAANDRYVDVRICALFFSIIILNAAFNPRSVMQIENPITRFLGEISYGMYMYHVYAICLTLTICWVFFKGPTFPYQHLIVATLTTTFTIGLAKLSYDYIEQPIRALARRKKRDVDSLDAKHARGTVL